MGHNAVAVGHFQDEGPAGGKRLMAPNIIVFPFKRENAPFLRRIRLESRQLSADFHEVVGQRDHFQPDPSARDAYK